MFWTIIDRLVRYHNHRKSSKKFARHLWLVHFVTHLYYVFPWSRMSLFFFYSSSYAEPCAFEELHRGTESGSLNGRSYFPFVLMIFEWYEHHAIINIPEGVLMVGGHFVWINVLFYFNISLHFFFSSVFSFTPSYLSIVMNLLLTTWPLPFIPSNFLYYLSLSYYLLGLTFFLLLMDYCPGGMRAEVTENTI